eukprot:gene8668-17961_t
MKTVMVLLTLSPLSTLCCEDEMRRFWTHSKEVFESVGFLSRKLMDLEHMPKFKFVNK